jgi:outer membrane biogenesis lipoprotein LolB
MRLLVVSLLAGLSIFASGCASTQPAVSEADRAKVPAPPVMSVPSEASRTTAADDARNPNLTRNPPEIAATPAPKRESGRVMSVGSEASRTTAADDARNPNLTRNPPEVAAIPVPKRESGNVAAVAPQNIIAKGRISVTSESMRGPQQTQGSFELNADAVSGRLEFFNPLGGTVAVLAWSPTSALLRRPNGEVQPFESAELMVQTALGVPLAPAVLVQWLRGEPVENAAIQGLSADGFRQYGWNVSVERDLQEPALTQRSGYPKRLDFSRLGSQKLDVRIALQEVVLVKAKATEGK